MNAECVQYVFDLFDLFGAFVFVFADFLQVPLTKNGDLLTITLTENPKIHRTYCKNVPRTGAQLDPKPSLGGSRGGLGVIWQGLEVPCRPRVPNGSQIGP